MIDAMRAVQIAKEEAAKYFGPFQFTLEEIERDTYKEHDAWSITLGMPRDLGTLSAIAALAAGPLQYKRFLIDANSGELLAMKLRELATQ